MLTRLFMFLCLCTLGCFPAAAQTLVYTANQDSGTISLIDKKTKTVAANPALGASATSLALTPDGGKLFVASGNGGGEGASGGSVYVVDTVSNTAIASLSVNNPFWIALNRAGTRAYFTNSLASGVGFVSVIDVSTGAVVTNIPVGNRPLGIAVTPNGNLAYVANATDDTVYAIDTISNTVIASIAVPSFPWGVACSPDGTSVYVSSQSGNTLSVIDTGTNAVSKTISVGSLPLGVAVNPNGMYAYVALSGANSVAVIDISTNTVTTTVPVGSYPIGVAVTPNGDSVFVANAKDSSVSVIDTSTNTIKSTISLAGGSYPFGIGISPN